MRNPLQRRPIKKRHIKCKRFKVQTPRSRRELCSQCVKVVASSVENEVNNNNSDNKIKQLREKVSNNAIF